jgi:ribosomal protein S21
MLQTVHHNDITGALAKLKSRMKKQEVFESLADREHFQPSSVRKRIKIAKAAKVRRKEAKKKHGK